MSWNQEKISDVAIIGDGAHASIKRVETGVPYLTSKNFKADGLDTTKLDFISESDYQKHFKEKSKALTKPQENDLVVGIIGTLGSPYLVRKTDRFGLSSSVAILRPDSKKILPKYLLYWMKSPNFQHSINQIKSGVAQSFLSLGMIGSLPVSYPQSLDIQQKIAGILAAYDDLIENNLKRINLLEEMAQITYEEWFVRLRFPGHESTPINPETCLPEGWSNREVGSFGKLKGGKQLIKDRFIDNGNVSVFGGAGMMGRTDVKNASGYVISVGRVGAYCGKFVAHRGDAWINNNASYFILNAGTHPEWFFITLKNLDLENIRKGAAQPFVSNSDIEKLSILYAGDVLTTLFQQIISPIFHSIENYHKQNEQLREARDILLPRLMTGVIDVEKYDPAQLLKEAA